LTLYQSLVTLIENEAEGKVYYTPSVGDKWAGCQCGVLPVSYDRIRPKLDFCLTVHHQLGKVI